MELNDKIYELTVENGRIKLRDIKKLKANKNKSKEIRRILNGKSK